MDCGNGNRVLRYVDPSAPGFPSGVLRHPAGRLGRPRVRCSAQKKRPLSKQWTFSPGWEQFFVA